jgi:DNA polymerase elongation subunit (family B)
MELGRGKVEYEGSLDLLFKENLEKFIEYNLEDVKLLVDMDAKLKFIELARGICHVGHVPYEDYSLSSRFLEGTIVVYLHRKGIVVTDRPKVQKVYDEDGAEVTNEGGFAGAYVKVPMPSLYNWIYSLDLQSLYPSIIRSLNISPETKVGFVRNYDVSKHMEKNILAYVVQEVGSDTTAEMERDEFLSFLEENNLSLSSNGVLYTNDKRGIIPEVLQVWFDQRVEFKNLMKQYVNEGNKELAEYYDRRQHIQKIFLNSMYGVLGLPSFRFYDVDNAQAVTISGQDVIKSSADFVNNLYISRNVQSKTKAWLDKYWAVLKEDAKSHKRPSPPYPSEDDHCVYIDTDSLYFSAETFLDKFNTDEEKQEFTIKLARAIESKLNKYYDEMAKDFFNCTNHQFFIKGESIAKTGIWTGKKRYALDKVYDLETNQPVSKTVFKGLDVVRSSFPKVFREFMKPLINDFLKGVSKEVIDQKILDFKASLQFTEEDISDVARNTSANGVSEYDPGSKAVMNQFMKGTPVGVKSALVYNRLLKHFNLDTRYEPIADGEKIKYVFLKDNPFRIEAIAFKGYKDPKKIMEFIVENVDTNDLFERELKNKLEDFYSAREWGMLPTDVNQKASEFFSF